MPTIDRSLRHALDKALDPDNADALLALMPPDWTQLATKTDLAVTTAELRAEMAELRGELKAEMAELRGELKADMANLRGELTADMANLRGEFAELRGEFGQLRGEVKAESAELRGELKAQRSEILTILHQELRKQTFFFISTLLATTGLLASIQLLA